MSILLNKEITVPIVDWFADNIEGIKEDPEDFGARRIQSHLGAPWMLEDLHEPSNHKPHDKNFPIENLKRVEVELKKLFNIPKDAAYARMGVLISYSEKGYLCRLHKDPTVDDHCHARVNVLISKPSIGGDPIIVKTGMDGKYPRCRYPIITSVKENEPWICIASEFEHSTTLQDGDIPRIMISIGYDVPRNILEKNGYVKSAKENILKKPELPYDDRI